MLKTTLTKFMGYLLALIDIVEENDIKFDDYKSIKKIENKIFKISTNLKS